MKKTIRILAVIIAMTCIFSGTAFAQEKEVAVEKSSSIAKEKINKEGQQFSKAIIDGFKSSL